jgi:UPF0755 protein
MAFIRITSPIRFFSVFLLLAVLFTLAGVRIIWGSATIQQSGTFEIKQRQGAESVWQQLEEEGFVSRVLPLRYHSWRLQAANQLKAGAYDLRAGESVADVVARFIAGDVSLTHFSVTYPEGFTLAQIAARTANRGIGTEEEFLALATVGEFADQFPFLADLPPDRTLE